jgi:carotenoid cleavage dioxygenase
MTYLLLFIILLYVNNINCFLNLKNKNILKNLNGFYGLIGPDIKKHNFKNISSLHELFAGDGIIQGVFFEKGKSTFVKHLIQTDKKVFEEKYGIIPKEPFTMLIFFIFNKFNLLPNVLGVSNTAFININNKIYTLFERDHPYQIDIDFDNKSIKTIGRKKISSLEHFSAHSKYNNNIIDTIDYKLNSNIINYFKLNKNFKKISELNIKLKYIPIVHDFYSDDNKLIVFDSPLKYELNNILKKKLPIVLDTNKNTYIYYIDKLTNQIYNFTVNEAFYVFHFVDVKEDDKYIKIFASVYNNLDFNRIDFEGKYRLIQINKLDNTTTIFKNKEMELCNLDFPIQFEDKFIMLNMHNKIMNGFIIVKELKIYKKILFKNKNICGEQRIIYIKNIPYLIFFNVEKNKNYVSLINLINYDITNIEVPEQLNLGFHSIFLDNSLLK